MKCHEPSTHSHARVQDLKPTGAKIIAGVLLLRSALVIKFIKEPLAGLEVPDRVAQRIERANDPMRQAAALATEQVRALREIPDGVHIIPLGADAAFGEIVRGAGLAQGCSRVGVLSRSGTRSGRARCR